MDTNFNFMIFWAFNLFFYNAIDNQLLNRKCEINFYTKIKKIKMIFIEMNFTLKLYACFFDFYFTLLKKNKKFREKWKNNKNSKLT